MKNLFTGVLILNFLIEGFAAVFLISAPESLFAQGQIEAANWARNYAFAALAFGSAIFWTWPHRDNIKWWEPCWACSLLFKLQYLPR